MKAHASWPRRCVRALFRTATRFFLCGTLKVDTRLSVWANSKDLHPIVGPRDGGRGTLVAALSALAHNRYASCWLQSLNTYCRPALMGARAVRASQVPARQRSGTLVCDRSRQ